MSSFMAIFPPGCRVWVLLRGMGGRSSVDCRMEYFPVPWRVGTSCDMSLVFFVSHFAILYLTINSFLLSFFVSSISCEYLISQWVQAQYLWFIYQGNDFHVSSECCCTVRVPNFYIYIYMAVRIWMPRSAQLFCDWSFCVIFDFLVSWFLY